MHAGRRLNTKAPALEARQQPSPRDPEQIPRITEDNLPDTHALPVAYEAHWPSEKRARTAEGHRRIAQSLRAYAEKLNRDGDEGLASTKESDAEYHGMMAEGLERLPSAPVRLSGGEVALADDRGPAQRFKETLAHPDTTAAAASYERMHQAERFGQCELAQAIDAAETIQARDSLERMAAHQLAALHATAMKTMAAGAKLVDQASEAGIGIPRFQLLMTEGCRMIAAATRMMATFQTGHATIARIRQGGNQTVKVVHQYVNVAEGGQAVVAGELTPPGGRRGDGSGS